MIRTYMSAAEQADGSGSAPAEEKPDETTVTTDKKPDEVAKVDEAPKGRDTLSEIDAQLSARAKEIGSKADAIEARLERLRQKDVIGTLRRLGADPSIVSDQDLLALAPKVDPEEPAGLEALVAFKNARPGFFKKAQVGPQERLQDLVKSTQENKQLPAHIRERKERMLRKVYGG